MKSLFCSFALLAILALSTSFNVFETPVTSKTTPVSPKCGPWFKAFNAGLSVTRITLSYFGTVIETVANPTFPYSFPQGGGGTYTVTVEVSSVPSTGLYVAAGDQCVFSKKHQVSVTFLANSCTQFDINISGFSCD